LDEAQQIPNIGMGLKILVDQVPGIIVIATGSSSFDLAGAIGEPLTGRKKTVVLYPVSQQELVATHNRFELRERLADFLVFGSYPEVVTAGSRKEKISQRLARHVQ
jgi:predicted AAA+ superfamily ATPase